MLTQISKIGRKSFWEMPLWFWFSTLCLSLLKLWLVAGQRIFAIGIAGHDDRLFVNLANNLLNFQWLGSYNNLTLAKGPFYPAWIAVSYAAHIPLFFSQHLLYILATLFLAIALRPLFEKSGYLLVIFTIVLFNPVSFADGPATRVIREGIYPALTMLTIAFFAGLFLRFQHSPKKNLIWSLGAGLALSCFWLTREEGVWILPLTIFLSLYSLFRLWQAKKDSWQAKMALILLPFVLLCASITALSTINYAVYGIYGTVEFKNTAFLNAYGALTRVKAPIWLPDVPVSAAQRAIIYSISPSFSELKPFLEGDLGKAWSKNGTTSESAEIKGGWFMWAFRDAVTSAGYYKNGPRTMEYYQKLADEVNSACNSRRIVCSGQRGSMMSPWNKNYLKPMFTSIYQGLLSTVKIDGFTATPSASFQDEISLKLFSELTRGDVTKESNATKISILAKIGSIYRFILPLAFLASLLIFLFKLITIKNSYRDLKFILSLAILASFLTRIVALALVDITAFSTMNLNYLSSDYPLLLLFVLLNLLVYTKKSSQ